VIDIVLVWNLDIYWYPSWQSNFLWPMHAKELPTTQRLWTN